MDKTDNIREARVRLIEGGGRTSHDLGAGRIVGQILVYLYLQETASSLDDIGRDLGVSKASVSVAVRQLEQFGLARKVWKSGDKRNFYKSADNIATALQKGVLTILRQKIEIFGTELDSSLEIISKIEDDAQTREEVKFLKSRIERAQKLHSGLALIFGTPIIKFLTGLRINRD